MANKLPTQSSNYKPFPQKPEVTSKLPKAPTKEEMDERKKKGLCMWCGVKYSYAHQCVRSQLYQLLVDEEDESKFEGGTSHEEGESRDEQSAEDPNNELKTVISLHALLGTEKCISHSCWLSIKSTLRG